MNDKQSIPERLPRRRSSIMDDGPIAIYQAGGSPQVAHGISMPAVAAMVCFAAFAGMTAIYFLGNSPSAAGPRHAAIETAAEDGTVEPDDVATTEAPHAAGTVRTAALAVDEVKATAGTARAAAAGTGARLPVKQLTRDDPRWTAGAGTAASSPAAAAIRALANDYQSEDASGEGGRIMAFAARPESPGAALEPEPDLPEEAPTIRAAPAERAAPAPAAPPKVSRTAQVVSGVNMRSRPRQGASVITVIPARASVGVVDCDQWCHVVYEGREGYVFRDFVQGRARATATPVSARPAAPAQPESAEPAERPRAPEAAAAPEPASPPNGMDESNRGR